MTASSTRSVPETFKRTPLQIATRNFLATGEAVFRRHRDDPHFDFSPAAVEYAKSIEVETSQLLRPGLLLINERGHQTLGALARLLKDPPQPLAKWLATAFGARKSWFTGELAPRLDAIASLRNPAAHGESVSRVRASSLRDETLGIGQEGLIVQLVRLAK